MKPFLIEQSVILEFSSVLIMTSSCGELAFISLSKRFLGNLNRVLNKLDKANRAIGIEIHWALVK